MKVRTDYTGFSFLTMPVLGRLTFTGQHRSTLRSLQTLSHQFAHALSLEATSKIMCLRPGQCCPQMGMFLRYGKYYIENLILLSSKTVAYSYL